MARLALPIATLCVLAAPGVQAQQTTGIVFARNCDVEDSVGNCIDNPTAEDRRRQDERIRQRQLQLERERLERERKAAEQKRKVDEQARKMGEHRRAEAERYVKMMEAAAEARNRNRKPQSEVCRTARVSCE